MTPGEFVARAIYLLTVAVLGFSALAAVISFLRSVRDWDPWTFGRGRR